MNNPRNLAIGAAGVAALVYFTPGNPFNTPAVKAVGDAHAKGGAAPTHTPAISTGRGSRDDARRHQGDGGTGTDHFRENVANQQQEPGTLKKQVNEAFTGHELGRPTGENSQRTSARNN